LKKLFSFYPVTTLLRKIATCAANNVAQQQSVTPVTLYQIQLWEIWVDTQFM